MVHADGSHFANHASKAEVYDQLISEAQALFEGQRNWVCNLANASSLLWFAFHSLPSPSNSVNWAGFYTTDPHNPTQLILGPFHGRPACQSIKFGKGVCGTAAVEKRVVRLGDVEDWPGHIACDAESRSEIVVPILKEGKVVAIIDIDCGEIDGFDVIDEEGLQRLATTIGESCDWTQ